MYKHLKDDVKFDKAAKQLSEMQVKDTKERMVEARRERQLFSNT